MKKSILILLPLAMILAMNACKPETEHDHMHEVITTLKVNVKDSSNVQLLGTYRYADTDGAGGNAPVFDTIKLDAGTTYRVSLEVLDESEGNNTNLTADIMSEAKDHLFVIEGSPLITAEITDRDENGLPIGFESRWTSGAAGTGSLSIRLKHQPGVKDGTATPGDTDLEVVFPVVIR